ncbi:hypothetical protein FB593_104342, partial [Rhizobium sp. SJZ105]
MPSLAVHLETIFYFHTVSKNVSFLTIGVLTCLR